MPVSPHATDKLDALGVYASPRQNVNKKQSISMLIDLEGVYVETTLVAVVRAAGDDQTVIFTSGQDAASAGHLIDMPCEEVIERLQSIQHHEFAKQILAEIESGEVVEVDTEL